MAHNFRLKGVATLLGGDAAPGGPPGREVRLVIVGGKHIDSWRRHVARLGLSEQVVFAGRVDDPLPYYAAADCYVHPTYYDPCSLVVLEAAACGLPLITSRYNGASEMFRDGEDVLLVDDPADDAEWPARCGPCWTTRPGSGWARRPGPRSCNIRSIATWTRFWKSIERSSTAAADCRRATGYWKRGSAATNRRGGRTQDPRSLDILGAGVKK